MIDGVRSSGSRGIPVDAEVAVVDAVILLHVDGRVLGIMLREVERELLCDALGVDGGSYFRLALVEHGQNGIVDIVVEEDDALLGRADKVGDKGVGIEDLL